MKPFKELSTVAQVALYVLLVVLGVVGAKLTAATPAPAPKLNPELIAVNKQELYELTYQWAMYKEISIITYMTVHECSKEDAKKNLELLLNQSTSKKYIADYEYQQKWEPKK